MIDKFFSDEKEPALTDENCDNKEFSTEELVQCIDFLNKNENIRRKYNEKYSIAGSSSRGLGESTILHFIPKAKKSAKSDIQMDGKEYQVKELTNDNVFMAGTKKIVIINKIITYINLLGNIFDDISTNEKLAGILIRDGFYESTILDQWLRTVLKIKKNGTNAVIDFTDISSNTLYNIFVFSDCITDMNFGEKNELVEDIQCCIRLYFKILRMGGANKTDTTSEKYYKIEKEIKREFFEQLDGLITVDCDVKNALQYKLFNAVSFLKNFELVSISQTVRPRFKYIGNL